MNFGIRRWSSKSMEAGASWEFVALCAGTQFLPTAIACELMAIWNMDCHVSRPEIQKTADSCGIMSNRKWMFNTTTVIPIDMDTRTMVNNRYFPSNGTARDVGGMISANSKKNTVNDTSILLHKVTWKRIKKYYDQYGYWTTAVVNQSCIPFHRNRMVNKTPKPSWTLTRHKGWSNLQCRTVSYVAFVCWTWYLRENGIYQTYNP